MTFRTRTAPKPTRRRVRRSDTRRAVYITITFTLAIACSLSLMGGVFVASYYTDHGAPIAGVNGEAISKDAVKDREKLDLARYDREIADYQTMRNQGKITTDEYSALEQTVTTSESTVNGDALTELINEAEIRQYASKNNINVSDQQGDAQIQTDSTFAEMRHVETISVPSQPTPPASAITQSDIDSAQTKAQGYLTEIQGGKKFADVMTEADASGDSTNSGGGDLGLITKSALVVDPNLADAIFALAKPGDITSVLKGTDNSYRFATVTDIAPQFLDSAWESTIAATSNGDLYRAYARNEAIKKAVENVIEAKYVTGPTDQREVREIGVKAGYGQPGDGDEVELRIIVCSPSHDESGAANVVTTDPAWTEAKTRADAAVAALRADPTKWASMVADTKINDDTGWNTGGGVIPWIPYDIFNTTTETQQQGLDMQSVATAVFKDGLAPGTILDPIQIPAQGWAVVQFQGRRPAPDQRIANAQFEVNNGTDFGAEAKLMSEAADAATGGDLGWVSPYMLKSVQLQAIDATPVGRVSTMVNSSGYFIFLVVSEQTRTADADQQAKLLKVVFPNWLDELQAGALVWEDNAAVSAAASASPGQ